LQAACGVFRSNLLIKNNIVETEILIGK